MNYRKNPLMLFSLLSYFRIKNPTPLDSFITQSGKLAGILLLTLIVMRLIWNDSVIVQHQAVGHVIALLIYYYFMSLTIVAIKSAGQSKGLTGFKDQANSFFKVFLIYMLLPASLLTLVILGLVFFIIKPY